MTPGTPAPPNPRVYNRGMSPGDPAEQRRKLEQAIAVQENLCGSVDNAIIDAAIASIQVQLAALDPPIRPTESCSLHSNC
jgi:hypothetical protein